MQANNAYGTYIHSSSAQLESLQPKRLNNTVFAQRDLLVFNRVPKVGSETLIGLIRSLSTLNGFGFSRSPYSAVVHSYLNKDEQVDLANVLIDLGESHAFAMHVNYIDFRQFDKPQPIYINLVRDPVERIISWFYYKRTPWSVAQMYKLRKIFRKPQWYKKDFEQCVLTGDIECSYIPGSEYEKQSSDHRRQTLFFCGHDPVCEPFNTNGALQLAMKNVEREYAVVGSWDDLNVTLDVLENYVPRFFRGAIKLFFDPKNGLSSNMRNTNPWKPKVSQKIKDLLRQNFTKEYEFYNFCKQRLYKQYFAIKNLERSIIS